MPASSTWPGLATCPSPLFPQNSPPLLYGATTGSTPFRLNLHVGDVGHTLIFGPTGCRQIHASGTDRRAVPPLSKRPHHRLRQGPLAVRAGACGRRPALRSCRRYRQPRPLPARQSSIPPRDMAFAEDWLATCYQLQQGAAPTPAAEGRNPPRDPPHARDRDGEGRSLTDFIATVQDKDIRVRARHLHHRGRARPSARRPLGRHRKTPPSPSSRSRS